MKLIHDYVHTYRSYWQGGGKCRVRIFEPAEERDSSVVIVSAMPNSRNTSVTNMIEYIAAEILVAHEYVFAGMPAPVFIEHYPPEARSGGSETFDLVTFESYEPERVAAFGGFERVRIGRHTWKRLDHAMVEALVKGDLRPPRRRTRHSSWHTDGVRTMGRSLLGHLLSYLVIVMPGGVALAFMLALAWALLVKLAPSLDEIVEALGISTDHALYLLAMSVALVLLFVIHRPRGDADYRRSYRRRR